MAVNYGIKHEWTDSEELMADFYDSLYRELLLNSFHHREEIIADNGLKNDADNGLKNDAVDTIKNLVNRGMVGYLRDFLVAQLIKQYAGDGVAIPAKVADEINEFFGYRESDEDYIHGTN